MAKKQKVGFSKRTSVVLPALKILIIRFSSIGDIVLTSAVVRCLYEQIPEVEIHFATKAKFGQLLAGDQRIHRVHELDSDFKGFAKKLKQEQFDQILDLHNNVRTRRLKLYLRRPSKSFRKINVLKWLYVRFKLNFMPKAHIVERYMETCKHLGVVYDGKGLDFYPIGSLSLEVSEQLPDKFGVYAIGGTYATKKMPAAKIEELMNQSPLPLVFIGDHRDAEILQSMELGSNHLNLCGKLTIAASALVMQRSEWVIAHDTGMMHIAAALKKPVISIWGNTTPDFGMWPLFPLELQTQLDKRSEVLGLGCRPCSKLGFDRCPKGHFNCMQEQNITKIVEKLQDRLHP